MNPRFSRRIPGPRVQLAAMAIVAILIVGLLGGLFHHHENAAEAAPVLIVMQGFKPRFQTSHGLFRLPFSRTLEPHLSSLSPDGRLFFSLRIKLPVLPQAQLMLLRFWGNL
jgi:hypothetical protein